jgi:predicted esterase
MKRIGSETIALCALVMTGCALKAPEEPYCGLTSQAGITVRKPAGVTAAAHLPTILFHHGMGGNWSEMTFDAERAVAHGYVAVMVNTRLSATSSLSPPKAAAEGQYWQGARETQCLIRMLRNDAKGTNKYNVDPNKIAFAGYSMGGIMGYHITTTSAAGWEVAKEVVGTDPLAAQYPAESGQPNAFIAISAALDPVAAGTGCMSVSRPFIARYDNNRAILHDWVHGTDRGRAAPYSCASDMTADELRTAQARLDKTSQARSIVTNATKARIAGYSSTVCTGACDQSCTDAGGVCARSVSTNACACHIQELLSPNNTLARELVSGTATYIRDGGREGWERWFSVSHVDAARKTPVLMLHGDTDPLVHASASGLAYDLLSHLGYSVKLVTFADVNHVWNTENMAASSPERIVRNEEIFQFLDRNLGWKGTRLTDACTPPAQVSTSQVAAATTAALASETLTDAEREYIAEDLATLAATPAATHARHCEANAL